MEKPMEMSHSIFPRIQPHIYSWTKTYGKFSFLLEFLVGGKALCKFNLLLECFTFLLTGMNFLNWHGSQAQLFVTEPELIKEILMNREGFYPKMEMEGHAKNLLGESLITNEGEKWAKIRKLANHTFHAESLKVYLRNYVHI